MTVYNNKKDIKEENLWIKEYLRSKEANYLAQIYERYKKQLFHHILKIIKNTEEAKDLTSESFIKAFENLAKFKTGSPFFPWLSRIATNLSIDQIRRNNRYQFEEVEKVEPISDVYVEENEPKTNKELQYKILHTIRMLKPMQKRCFCLFYIHHLSYDDITKITGYPFKQVRSHIQNGRRKFRILMERQ